MCHAPVRPTTHPAYLAQFWGCCYCFCCCSCLQPSELCPVVSCSCASALFLYQNLLSSWNYSNGSCCAACVACCSRRSSRIRSSNAPAVIAVSAKNILQQVVAIFYFFKCRAAALCDIAGILIYLLIFTVFQSQFQFRFPILSTGCSCGPWTLFLLPSQPKTFHSSTERWKLCWLV